jgi:hypothetical protein
MNSAKIVQRALLIVLAGLTIVCTPRAQTSQKTEAWGTPVNGLQMSLSLGPATVPPSAIPAITLSLRNVGSGQLNVLLGGYCGVPQVAGPNSVFLNLTDSSGNSERLMDLGPPPYQAGCGGAAYFFAVPLPPGAEYSIPLKLDNYKFLSDVTKKWESGWQPGYTYSMQAELKNRPAWQGWDGLVTSNKLEVHFPAS